MAELTPEQQAVQDRIDFLAPLRAVVASDAYAEVMAGLEAQRTSFIDERSIFSHLNALTGIMPRLKGALEREPTELPPAPAPLPVLQPEG